MKRVIYILLLSFPLSELFAQNLVPNWSFEGHSNCPNGAGGISLHIAASWDGWDSSDYFNSCSTDSQYSVPQNILGYQLALTDTSYAGIGLYVPTTNPFSSEFIQVELTDSMRKFHYYCVSFFANLADSSNYAIQNLGAYLSKDAISLSDIENNIFIPQIENHADSVLNDKANWKEISGYYYSNGGEKFLTIGNFYTNSNTVNQHLGGATSPFYDAAYYYIDNVSVLQCDSLFSSVNSIIDSSSYAIYPYPNPNTGVIWFKGQFPEAEKGNLNIHDLTGKLVYTSSLDKNSAKMGINVGILNAGIYMYDIVINNKKMKTDKLIIMKD